VQICIYLSVYTTWSSPGCGHFVIVHESVSVVLSGFLIFIRIAMLVGDADQDPPAVRHAVRLPPPLDCQLPRQDLDGASHVARGPRELMVDAVSNTYGSEDSQPLLSAARWSTWIVVVVDNVLVALQGPKGAHTAAASLGGAPAARQRRLDRVSSSNFEGQRLRLIIIDG
jgi:hypothetical protein